MSLEPAPRTVRGARDLLSVGLQYGNAFLRGFQAAALKPADFFGDDDVLYLMEDMATGEIRLSILWEWLHKGAPFTDDDADDRRRARATRSPRRCSRGCSRRSTRSSSPPTAATSTTTPRRRRCRSPARSSRATSASEAKPTWYIDLLNRSLGNEDLAVARERIAAYVDAARARRHAADGEPGLRALARAIRPAAGRRGAVAAVASVT